MRSVMAQGTVRPLRESGPENARTVERGTASAAGSRKCGGCGRPLSRYNKEERCSACAGVVGELGGWLREQREARGWARPEMARRLIQAGKTAGDKSLPGLDSMCHNLYRWERGLDSPSERYRLYYIRALGILPGQFGSLAAPDAQEVSFRCGSAAWPDDDLACTVREMTSVRVVMKHDIVIHHISILGCPGRGVEFVFHAGHCGNNGESMTIHVRSGFEPASGK
jgi:hypothetical protein